MVYQYASGRGLIVFLAVAFIPAYILDYTVVIGRMGSESLSDSLILLLALVARMWLPISGSIAALLVSGVRSIRSALGLLELGGPTRRWMVIAVIAPLAGYMISIPVSLALGARLAASDNPAGIPPLLIPPLLLLGVLAGVTINALVALGEEAGWRGYLLGVARVRVGFLPASLLVGIIWGLWHAPLIINGYNYNIPGLLDDNTPQGVEALAVFTIYTTALGLVLAMLKEYSGSTRTPAIAHGVVNGVAGVFTITVKGPTLITPPAGLAVAIGMAIVALVLAWCCRVEEGGR
ncbi:MAG: CPBP family intramembrane metalloprotease [Desulfurococcales archaeon]|nr:CPBP family intramembrane metalloprotease [Desulfurococcales archaeon]